MNIEVEKSDIKLIGHTIFNMNGYAAFACNATNCGIERILLRNILRCFGNDIAIIDSEDDWNDEGTQIEGITYITNLSYETYVTLEG